MATVVSEKFQITLNAFAEDRKNAHVYGANSATQSQLLGLMDPVNNLSEAVDLSLHVLHTLRNIDTTNYTTNMIAEFLQPFSEQILIQCGTDRFDFLVECWDVEEFSIAVTHNHWKGAMLILDRLPTDKDFPLGRDYLMDFYHALDKTAQHLQMQLDDSVYLYPLVEQVRSGLQRQVLSGAVQNTSLSAKKKM